MILKMKYINIKYIVIILLKMIFNEIFINGNIFITIMVFNEIFINDNIFITIMIIFIIIIYLSP